MMFFCDTVAAIEWPAKAVCSAFEGECIFSVLSDLH